MTVAKMSSGRKSKLRALARLMNKQNERLIFVNQQLLDCLDLVVSPKETNFLLRMGTEPLTYKQAASLTDMPEEQFSKFFETIIKRGVIRLQHDEQGEERFILEAIAVGWLEMQLMNGGETPEQKEFARRTDAYFNSLKKLNIFPLRNLQNIMVRHTQKPNQSIAAIKPPGEDEKKAEIDVRRTIEVSESKVYPTQSINEIIEQYGEDNPIGLVHCFCRQWRRFVSEPCRFNLPTEACIMIGDIVEHMVRYGYGRQISKEEALAVIEETQDKGAVHTVFYEKDDLRLPRIAICNCCWDCCGIMASYHRGISALQYKSYYSAQIVDSSSCTGCEKCVKHCPADTISIIEKKAVIDSDKCIGCGQCAHQCPKDVITLNFNERSVFLPLKKKSEVRIPEKNI
ncbi:MAG: 4Fe-4S binding protein [Deltaproteobacteria bacterium]|nr:MAG: 4Fe-4S binding protein [Deltaproteobacteria bacterium]